MDWCALVDDESSGGVRFNVFVVDEGAGTDVEVCIDGQSEVVGRPPQATEVTRASSRSSGRACLKQ